MEQVHTTEDQAWILHALKSLFSELSGEIPLGQDLIPITLKDCSGTLVVINMEDEESLPARTHEQGVAEEEIHFRHKEATEHTGQIGGTFSKLHDEHRRLTERDVVIVQEFGDERGIAHDHPSDGGLRRIDDTEGEDDHSVLLQKLYHLKKCSNLIVKKDGEVLYWSSRDGFQNGRVGWR